MHDGRPDPNVLPTAAAQTGMTVEGQVTVTWGSNPFPNGSRLGVTINAGSAPCVGSGSTTGTTTGSGTSGTPTTTPVGTPGVTALYFAHPDHLGTARIITKSDATNAKVWEWKNDDAFGNNQPDENPNNANAQPFKYNLRFPGQYFDVETNTSYNYFRDYDPSLGRYVQSDPIGLYGGINTYTYVRGNPLSYVDPYGLRDVDVYIWRARAEGLSVGHVMVTEANSWMVILSQFPSNGLAIGPNETKSYVDTLAAEEWRPPSEVWRIKVPDDAAFDASAARERGLKRWSANPSNSSTQCSIAASRALKAGGVGLNTVTTGTLMPGFFANGLQSTPGVGVRLP